MNVQPHDLPVMRTPDPSNTRPLRDAFARFATGVTVITAQSDMGPVAMTANSFTSVSLDPPLVLWSVARKSRRYSAFAEAKHYTIHVLSAEQRDLCDLFAKDGLALADMPYDLTDHGVPVMTNCLARFDCRQTDIHKAGDHSLIVGEVEAAGFRSGAGLTFFSGVLSEHDVVNSD